MQPLEAQPKSAELRRDRTKARQAERLSRDKPRRPGTDEWGKVPKAVCMQLERGHFHFHSQVFNFGNSMIIARPASSSRIMLNNDIDNVEKTCQVIQMPLANVFWGTCLGELRGTFEPKNKYLQPPHAKTVKLLLQAGWRTSNRWHILELKNP